MAIRPLSDRVLIEAHSAESTTQGGIIIPDTARDKSQKGTVIAVGPGKNGIPMQVQPGQTVVYRKNAGTEIKDDGKALLIMREEDIMCEI